VPAGPSEYSGLTKGGEEVRVLQGQGSLLFSQMNSGLIGISGEIKSYTLTASFSIILNRLTCQVRIPEYWV
jgi:hypothetical protein